ncbi:MAG: tetratricopeptide repeat protein, partial [Rhodospirillales bacterium]
VLNAGLAGFGGKIVSDAVSYKKEALEYADSIRKAAEQAKKSEDVIKATIGSSYTLHDLQLKREVTRWIVMVPGLETRGETKDAMTAQFKGWLEAVKALEIHVPAEKRTNTVHFINAFLQFNDQHYEAAIESLKGFPDKIPEKFLLLGAAYDRAGNQQRAQWAFREAQDLSKRLRGDTIMAKAINGDAIIEAKYSRFDEAERLFNKALQTDPGLHGVHYNLAALYSVTKKFDAAISSLCAFRIRGEGNVFDMVDSDKDKSFENLKSHLGPEWRKTLEKRLYAC